MKKRPKRLHYSEEATIRRASVNFLLVSEETEEWMEESLQPFFYFPVLPETKQIELAARSRQEAWALGERERLPQGTGLVESFVRCAASLLEYTATTSRNWAC